MLYDVIIIGGGPAATAAAVYVARKNLTALLIAGEFGGQSVVSDDIQNWIGEPHISGAALAEKFEAHIRAYSDVITIKSGELVTKVEEATCNAERICDFAVTTDKGETHLGKTVIVASGARRRTLNVPGEAEYNGRGVAYCSTCDAPLFRNRDVAVVGAGNAGLEAVLDLVPFANHVTLLARGETLRGDPITQQQVKDHKKVTIIMNAQTQAIKGETLVTGLTYKDNVTGEEKELSLGGVFIEIGSVPNSEVVKGLVDIDAFGQIKVDAKVATTSHPGIFAAGDVTDDPFKQNNISVGDGVKAALSAYSYLQKRPKISPAAERNTVV